MPRLVTEPTRIESAGNQPKLIEEYIGLVNTDESDISIARMTSPTGWEEPGQRPEFREVTVVIDGILRVEFEGGEFDVRGGQVVIANPGEWVRYSTPYEGGARYVAICTPAFSPASVHRDTD